MRVGIKYGRGLLEVEIPERNLAGILTIQKSVPLKDPERAVWEAIQSPIQSPPLAELAKGRTSACAVISDITRPVPNKVILPPMLQTLEKNGIPRKKITILIATGIHRPNEGEELEEMVGAEIMRNYRIVNHLSQRPETHKYLGLTRNGTPVHIDKTYLESDLKITTALIEPHLMAGYSGGRKSICPGLASVETMKIMHGPELLEHPNARVGVLDENPFHIEATEIAQMAGVDFSLNVTLDDQRRLTGVFAGDLVESHLAGVRFVENRVKATVPAPVDAVLVSSAGYPLDTTFYQAIKGLLAAVEIVKQGGSIVLFAECKEGIGSKPFTKLILETKDLGQFIKDIYDPANFVIDQWQLEELAKVAKKAEIFFYCDGISYEQQRALFVQPLRTPEEGVACVLAKHGPEATIAAIPEGPYVLAKIAE
jgi:nickel-dependent lactate racemase